MDIISKKLVGLKKDELEEKNNSKVAKKNISDLGANLKSLNDVISKVNDPDVLSDVFVDLFTPAEWKAICDRWLVAQLVNQGVSYRKIYDITGVSTATITRVGRALNEGQGYKALLEQ